MSTVNHKLAKELIRLRGEMSLYEVSKACGIHRSTLQTYEQGKKIPEDKNLERLSSFYEVPFEALKMLIFEDRYPANSQDRRILCQWVHQIEGR